MLEVSLPCQVRDSPLDGTVSLDTFSTVWIQDTLEQKALFCPLTGCGQGHCDLAIGVLEESQPGDVIVHCGQQEAHSTLEPEPASPPGLCSKQLGFGEAGTWRESI